MVERPTHLATRYRDRLTPRQEEILSMIAKGKTNFEIAQALGISLDGAKWHVREILAKLNVESREDAALEWQRQSGFTVRLRAFARALVPAGMLAPLAAGAAVVAVAAVAVVGLVVLRGGGDETSNDRPPADETPSTPGPGSVSLNEPLPGDGSKGYAYTPQLAYVDPDGAVWLVNADGSGRRQVLDGCTGVGSAKSGVLTGGLRWSPGGDWIACWNEDLSVRAAALDGHATGQPFAAGECSGPVSGPVFPPGAPGVACETASGLQVRDLSGKVVTTYPTTLVGAHRWLPNGALITAGPDESMRMTWKVFAPDGSELAHIKDAYVGEPQQFAVSSDGTMIAYPGDRGLTVLHLTNGKSHVVESPVFARSDWRGGGEIGWALSGRALVVTGYPASALVDATTGESLAKTGLPSPARLSPDGRYLAGIIGSSDGRSAEIGLADLESGTVEIVRGLAFTQEGAGLGPHFTWSGDSSRFCWTMAANAVDAPKYCADVDDPGAARITAPVQFRAEELGYGDLDITWQAISPDLTRAIFTSVPPNAGVAVLTVVGLDGKGETGVGGAMLGQYPAAWRPDGVVRPR